MKTIVVALSVALVSPLAWGYEVHHPNLKDAYWAAEQAIQKIHEAQAANKGVEFGGHAEQEIVAGDQYNDVHRK
jgi:hypothetical protein